MFEAIEAKNMSEKEMIDDISSLFMAGLSTTTKITMGVLKRLSTDNCKDLQERIYQEICAQRKGI